MLSDEKILLTGPAGQIAFPMAEYLAKDNEVWGMARFGDPETKAKVEAIGVTAVKGDLGDADFSELPDDFTYVIHFAALMAPGWDFDAAIRANAEGTGLLLALYTALIARGLLIAANATSPFSRLLAGSVTLIFFTYAFVNMGMVSGILPVVGVPLPFVSYGGTALVTLFLGIGILMSVARERKLVQT